MYDGLETNIPSFLMEFSDAPTLRLKQLCPSREDTLRYLTDYAADVSHLVKFQTQVIELSRRTFDVKESWLVRYTNLMSGQVAEDIYDAVVIASGHYSVPFVPNIAGVRKWNESYPGIISHSKAYRCAQDFSGQKVLIVGYSASGRDIASQIAERSKLPVLVSQRSNPNPGGDTNHLKFFPEIAEFLASSTQQRGLRFVNGQVETDVDAIIFCTGYFYSYPFLSSVQLQFIKTGERVQHLYQHVFSIDHPSLAFLGLPKQIVPFRTFEGQAAVIARVWAGRLELPSQMYMREWEETILEEQGRGKKFHDLSFPKDVEYHNAMVDWAHRAREGKGGKMPMKWSNKDTWVRARCADIKQAFAERGEARHKITSMEELGFSYETWLSVPRE